MNCRVVLISILVLLSYSINAQIVIKDGKEVLLNSDGTWEYVAEEQSPRATRALYINDRKMESVGLDTLSYKHDYSDTDLTAFSIVKDVHSQKTLIIFWIESSGINASLFKNSKGGYWAGPIRLYLEDGKVIKLIDRNINGTNIIESGVNRTTRQSYSAFYLTQSEIDYLKNSPLFQISYYPISRTMGNMPYGNNNLYSTQRVMKIQSESGRFGAMRQIKKLEL